VRAWAKSFMGGDFFQGHGEWFFRGPVLGPPGFQGEIGHGRGNALRNEGKSFFEPGGESIP